MAQPDWETLESEVRELARRVAQLERHTGMVDPVPETRAAPPEAPARNSSAPTETAVLIAVLGRAFLGLAGAYLLRALTEAGTLPSRFGIAIGIAYAMAWLAWAARTPPPRRLEAAIHSLTAALVLSPLLWEATLHFHAIGTWTAGAILLLFILFGMAAAWRKNVRLVSTIATLAGLGTAAALLIATHDVLPFTFVFLAVAEAVEISACLEHWLSERWLAAAFADLAVLLATWLVTNQRGLPPAYAPIPHSYLLAAQVALLAIYLSSTIVRTLFCGFTFTNFETTQCAVAFAISVTGGLRLARADHHAGTAMAVLLLCCAAACYLVSFALLERRGAHGRNFYTYSTFGMLLALAGSRLLLSGAFAAGLWSVLAILCILAGGLFGRLTLELHGGIYLLLAVASLGALQQATAFLLGTATWPGDHATVLGAGALIATLGYALAARFSPAKSQPWNFAVLRLALAATFVWLVAGITAGWLTAAYHSWFGADATHAYCETLRTTVLAAASLLLAWSGSRWNRSELSRLIYPVMLLGGYRLLAADLHQDRKAALFFSLLVYGAALTALPKLKRAGA
jgi:hypothetical protein